MQGLLGRLSGLDFSAGELPHSGKVRGRRPPRHEQPARVGQGVQYCAANNADESSHALKSKAGAGSGARETGRAGAGSGRGQWWRRPPRHLPEYSAPPPGS